MPNEGHEHEIAPEEENRARFAHPKMREQIVDLLAGCDTHSHTHSLFLRLAFPPYVRSQAGVNIQLHRSFRDIVLQGR